MTMNVFEKSKAYQDIKKKIYKHLIDDWEPNDRLPPIKELARDLGVGQSSTHQAVKELVREGVLVSRPRLGTFVSDKLSTIKPELELMLNDKVVPIKAPLAGKKIQLITYQAVIELQSFFTQAIKSFTEAITNTGCEMITTLIDDTVRGPREAPLDKTAHGVIVINPSSVFNIKCLSSQVLAVISPSSECMVTMGERFDLIAADDIQGSLLAGNYFRERGWDDVCFLGAHNSQDETHYDKISAKRLDGFTLGLGKSIRPEWQLQCNGYVTYEAAHIVRQWFQLNPRPSAIFAASDDLAYGFIHGALAYGLFPGKDFQIIGFDAQIKKPFHNDITLTSISIPVTEMGSVAGKMLIKRLEDPNLTPQRIYLGCQLFEGNSVARRDQKITVENG